jgi:selenocysteine-specific elongation factor
VSARLEALAASGVADRFDDLIVARVAIDGLKTRLLALVGEHHRQHPLSDGLPREEARMRLFPRGSAAVFLRAVDDLARSGALAGRERLMLPSHRVQLSPDDARAQAAIEAELRAAGLRPPDVEALAARAGVSRQVAERVLQMLQRQKRLVKIDTLLFHDEALAGLKAEIAALKPSAATTETTIGVAMFKERFGVTRKFAIPLLEYLDRERVTRRVGDRRIVL